MLDKLPIRIKLPVTMGKPNEPVTIYTGAFRLYDGENTWELNGSIAFYWFPDLEVKFSGEVVNGPNAMFDLLATYQIEADGHQLGQARVFGNDMRGPWLLNGVLRKPVWGEGSVTVSEVQFAPPNIQEWLGDTVKEDKDSSRILKSRISLATDKYTITLDKLPDYKARAEMLDGAGGYILSVYRQHYESEGSDQQWRIGGMVRPVPSFSLFFERPPNQTFVFVRCT